MDPCFDPQHPFFDPMLDPNIYLGICRQGHEKKFTKTKGICKYFARGTCRAQSSCRFLHAMVGYHPDGKAFYRSYKQTKAHPFPCLQLDAEHRRTTHRGGSYHIYLPRGIYHEGAWTVLRLPDGGANDKGELVVLRHRPEWWPRVRPLTKELRFKEKLESSVHESDAAVQPTDPSLASSLGGGGNTAPGSSSTSGSLSGAASIFSPPPSLQSSSSSSGTSSTSQLNNQNIVPVRSRPLVVSSNPSWYAKKPSGAGSSLPAAPPDRPTTPYDPVAQFLSEAALFAGPLQISTPGQLPSRPLTPDVGSLSQTGGYATNPATKGETSYEHTAMSRSLPPTPREKHRICPSPTLSLCG